MGEGIDVYDIQLLEDPSSAGDILVSYEGAEQSSSSIAAAPLRLQLWDDVVLRYEIDVVDLNEPTRLTVPVGSYEARICSNLAGGVQSIGRPESVPVQVEAGHTKRLSFDVSQTGSLLLEAHRRNGEEYTGKLQLFLGMPAQVQSKSGVSFAGFPHPPYRLSGLPEQVIEVHVYFPGNSRDYQTPTESRVSIRPGEEAKLQLIVAD